MAKSLKVMMGLCMTLTVVALVATTAWAQMPQTTTQKTAGAATVTTEKLNGEVVKVEGNTLVVKMANGDLRTFSNIPDSRKAIVDGQEVGVRDLQPGTKLTATITRTTTPVTVRTTTVGTGKVWFVSGPNVILTLPNGENKQYKVKPDYKFNVNGQEATVYDLRPGMTVSAEKIVEEPTVEIATNTRVVGRTAAAAPTAAAPALAPVAGAATTGAASTQAAPTSKLPKTASPVPLMGLLGLFLIGGASAIRMLRRS